MFMAKGKRGAMTVEAIVALVVAIILLIGVAIPITQDVITDANLTGLTATIVGFIPVFIGIAGLVLVAKMLK